MRLAFNTDDVDTHAERPLWKRLLPVTTFYRKTTNPSLRQIPVGEQVREKALPVVERKRQSYGRLR